MHPTGDLVVAKAGVAGIASPCPRLHPHVFSLPTDGCPLINPIATRSAPTEWSSTATIGAVDRKRANVFRALCNAEVDGAAPAHVCARLSRFDPVSREDGREVYSRCVCADRTTQDPSHKGMAAAVLAPPRIAVSSTGDLVVTKAGVGGVTAPGANLHPAVGAVRHGRPLVTGLRATKRWAAATVGTVDAVWAEFHWPSCMASIS